MRTREITAGEGLSPRLLALKMEESDLKSRNMGSL